MEKNKIIKMSIVVLISICAIIYFFMTKNRDDEYIEILSNVVTKENTVSEQIVENISKIKIYITGEVKNPGVFELDEGARIDDAIKIADGLTQDADLENVNLAYELSDGEKVYIPNKDEEEQQLETSNNKLSNGKVNINKASLAELINIQGIGSSTAQKIIEYREKNGKFASIEDIKKVAGIGEAKFDSIKEYISIK